MSNQKQTDAQALRQLASNYSATDSADWLDAITRVASQLESDAKRYDSEKLQAIGKSAYESVAEMVAALECDYDRLAELAQLRIELFSEFNSIPANDGVDFDNWARNQTLMTSEDCDEYHELANAAGDCTDRDDAERRIQEDPLSVEVRSGWYSQGCPDDAKPQEFVILLSTGGPATRIRGELQNGEPTRAWIEAQDWGTPWTQYIGGDQETLLTYCRQFYFGEG